MVNGLINKNVSKEEFSVVDFVIYEYIDNLKLSEQLKKIKKLKLNLVNATNDIKSKDINDENLSNL